MEKEELLSQIFFLQKEVSRLSSTSLAREKEALRKELDKTKSKLKDTESKLKNTIQDKVKLEVFNLVTDVIIRSYFIFSPFKGKHFLLKSEKAQIERQVKCLHGQQAVLERNMLKQESNAVAQKNLQVNI